jgi:DNA invertase Pin-like site-specific DNA recombinase
VKKLLRCAIYTRVSSDQRLEQDFNSLDAQREAAEAYIKSQAHEGWRLRRDRYDDGGFSGGSMERPALSRLLADIRARRIDVVVVYKVDRLTRSLSDFAKLVELFDSENVSFVSVTQSFNTTSSMGRLTLNVLLSFAQFEREVTGERIRDKIAASKRKGLWMGGSSPARIQRREPQANRRRGGGRNRQKGFRAVPRSLFYLKASGGAEERGCTDPGAGTCDRAHRRKCSSHQRAAGLHPQEPHVSRRD